MHGSSPLTFVTTAQWCEWLEAQLPKPRTATDAPLVLDLFAGCGGLALGFEAAGFRTVGYEMAAPPVATYNKNLDGECHQHRLDIGDELPQADVVVGGPPCQPFSQIGYQRGRHDLRDGFPIFLDAVRRTNPKIAIIENVRGLLFRNKDYLKRVMAELKSFGYEVDCKLLNTADYGVPQKRERVVVVASRCGWEWPDRITAVPVSAGIALGELASERSIASRFLTPSMDAYIATYEAKSSCIQPRDLHLDKPARTLTCRNLAGATADMLRIRLHDGRRRMLHLREAARLQSFPDWFEFAGADEYARFEQIGNSVAPLMSLGLARSVMDALNGKASVARRAGGSDQGELFAMGKVSAMETKNSSNEKVEQAQNILRQVGVPLREMTDRRKERVAKALLAVAGLSPEDDWSAAKSMADDYGPLQTRAIIRFWNDFYDEKVADSSYDDVRRNDLIWLVEFGLVDKSAADPDADVNDGTRGYALSDAAVPLLRAYGTDGWEIALAEFRGTIGDIADRLSKAREMKLVPVQLPDGGTLKLTPGPHNELQKDVVEQFLPRFAPGAELLYLGDAKNKTLYVAADRLEALGLPNPSRETLPDVVAFDMDRGWVFFVEAVSSFGPISNLRREGLKKHAAAKGRNHQIIFVTAFPNRNLFRKFSAEIGWETEVWIASEPTHLVHFDGTKYLTPYE